ncbi:MAG: flagellar protein FlaG, partial [Caldimicrobium sp.]
QEKSLADSLKVFKNQFFERLNKVLYSYNKALKIEIDKDLKIPVYKIIDLETKEVIKQIPLEDILKLKKAILEIIKREIKNPNDLKGIFFEGEA